MPAPALIYEKTVGPPAPERLLILNTRSLMVYPFEATNWTDLRVGFFLSLTTTLADDTPGGALAETRSGPGHVIPFADCYFIGVLDRATGTTFMGYSNVNPSRPTGSSNGDSMLVSSDGGIGTTNSNFWRPKNSITDIFNLIIIDSLLGRDRGEDGSQIHFAQVPAGAGGYATLLSLRFQRDTGTSRTITMTAKRDLANHSADILFNNDPSSLILRTNLEDFPATAQQLGPVELGRVPDVLYLYWPFTKTRLRCHALGLLKAA